MTFSRTQVDHFHQHGYLAVPEFFSNREVGAMQSEVERFNRDGLVRNVATDGDGETPSSNLKNLQLNPLYDKSDLFRALPFNPKVVGAVTQLLGETVLLHLDQMFLKPAKEGMGTSWHQDNAYFKIGDPLKGTAMWIAVHDANIANGTIHVIPDVFKQKYEHSRDPYSDHHIRCYPPEENAIACELPAGGVAFFCYGTPHATKANRTEVDRAGVAYHFLHTDCYEEANLINKERHPKYYPILTGPGASGGLKEYSIKVEGTWEGEVEKVLGADLNN